MNFKADPKLAAARIRAAFRAAEDDNYRQQALVHVDPCDVRALLDRNLELEGTIRGVLITCRMSKTAKQILEEVVDGV